MLIQKLFLVLALVARPGGYFCTHVEESLLATLVSVILPCPDIVTILVFLRGPDSNYIFENNYSTYHCAEGGSNTIN